MKVSLKRETVVLRERPPNFDKILAAFPGASAPGVIFAYGGFIYAPGDVGVSLELRAHERVHLLRQGYEQDAWWDRYIAEPQFRLEEEILAHRAEYREFARRHGNPTRCAIALQDIAAKLASPLYGALVTLADARKEILS